MLEAREPSARYLEAVPPTLVRQFDMLATAQGGAARLRELIVLLALQGKLVQQDPQEASALDWLAKIQARRDPLSAMGLVKTGKNLPLVEECERWFDLPATWTWARLNDLVVSSEAGWSPSCPETPRRGESWGVLKVSAVSWGKFDPAANKELPDELTPRPEYEVRPGDFLLSRANTAELVARSVVVAEAPPRLMLSDKIIRLTFAEGVNRAFINLCNNSGAARSYYVAKASGTSSSMKNVSREVVLGLPLPVPPVDEQARIVARVDELMRMCDALEAKGRLEAKQHARLLGTLLGTLTDSSTPEELAANWQRVADHFDLLLDRPEAVDALEQTILQLAVRGLLMPQDENDDPARVVLERIFSQRRSGQKQSPATLQRGDPVEPPYTLPSQWSWARLGDLVENMGSGWSPACEEGERADPARWAVLRTTAVQVMKYRAHEHKAIPLKLVPRPEIEVKPGDILVTRAGPMNRVGISCWVEETPARLMLSDKIVRFHPVSDELSPAFVVLALNAGWTRELLEAAKTGMAASQVNVSQSDLKSLWVPVCSQEEQTRILARVTELRHLCADLRQRLDRSSATQAALAEALIDQALAA